MVFQRTLPETPMERHTHHRRQYELEGSQRSKETRLGSAAGPDSEGVSNSL